MQNGRLSSVQVQHPPGNCSDPACQFECIHFTLSGTVQQQVKRGLWTVLHYKN